jgi:hypothetical protein
MQIKNRKINTDSVTGFNTTCDPFHSNAHVLTLYFDNGTRENFTFYNIDEFRVHFDELVDNLKRVKQYKIIVNGAPKINYEKRTKVLSTDKERVAP